MFKRNYTNHIALSIIICVAVPAMILFGIMQVDQSSFTKYHVSQVASQQIEDKVDDIHVWLSDKTFEIEQYGLAAEVYTKNYGFDDHTTLFLTEMANSNEEITYLYITTRAGAEYISDGIEPVLDGRTRPWYIGAVKQDVYISAPYKDILTNKPVVTFSKTIKGENGDMQGVIAMDVLLSEVVNKIESASSGAKYSIVMQSEDGSTPYISSDLEGVEVIKAIQKESDRYDVRNNSGRYTGVKYAFPEMHTSVYMFLNIQDYYLRQRGFNKDFIINSLVTIAVLLMLIKVSSGFIYRPLYRLSQYITRSYGDSAKHKMPELPVDLGQIGEKFIKLQNTLFDRQLEIKHMNMHVHERNNEIQNVNSELEASFHSLSQLKEELEAQEENYSDLVNNIPDIIWICDKNGNVFYGNREFEELIGSKVDSDSELYISDIVEGMNRNEDVMNLFMQRDYNHIEVSFYDLNNEKHDMEGSVSRIYESGRLVAIQGIFRDTTESRAMYFDYFNRNRELTLVNDITKSLISNVELDQVLYDIANKVGQIMSVSMCTIRLLIDDKFELAASAGSKEQVVYREAPAIDTSHMGIAYKENRSLILTSEIDFLMDDPDLYESMKILNSVIYIPLATNDNVYGVLAIGTSLEVKREKVKILETMADQAAIAIERMQIFEKLRNHYFKTIEALVAANDAKVPNMEGHTKRVSDIAVEVGKRMYLRKKDIDDIYIAGLLHDIGKMNISDALLSKDTDLSEEESMILNMHPMYAKKILEPIGMSKSITEGIYYHHKKYDLSGEPASENISSLPLIARIIGAVDDLDALMVGRDLGTPLPLLKAMDILCNGSGTDYCPEVIKILSEISQENPELIFDHYSIVQLKKEASI